MDDTEECDPPRKGECNMTERVMLVIFIIGFCMSEGLPFLQEFCGIRINGHGIFHIIHGLLTSDCAEVVEGLENVVEENDASPDNVEIKTVSD